MIAAIFAVIPPRAIMWGLMLVGLIVVGVVALKQHDARVLAAQNLVVAKAEAKAQAEQDARTIATLQLENIQARQDAEAAANVKRTIANAPVIKSCVGSPAVDSALRGLQPSSGAAAPQRSPR